MSTPNENTKSLVSRFAAPVGLLLFTGVLTAYSLRAGGDQTPSPVAAQAVIPADVSEPEVVPTHSLLAQKRAFARSRATSGTDSAVFSDLPSGLAALHAGMGSTPVKSAERNRAVADLDSRHAAESIDPVWSASQEQNLAMASESQVMSQAGFAPQDVDTDCRSSSCRISAHFDNSADARDWAERLLTQMAGTIGQARVAVLPQPDGRFEVRVYGSRRRST
jgi:hypothetical protein